MVLIPFEAAPKSFPSSATLSFRTTHMIYLGPKYMYLSTSSIWPLILTAPSLQSYRTSTFFAFKKIIFLALLLWTPHEAVPLSFAVLGCSGKKTVAGKYYVKCSSSTEVPPLRLKPLKKTFKTAVDNFDEIELPWRTPLLMLKWQGSLNNQGTAVVQFLQQIDKLRTDAKYVQHVEYRHCFHRVKCLLVVGRRKAKKNLEFCAFPTAEKLSAGGQLLNTRCKIPLISCSLYAKIIQEKIQNYESEFFWDSEWMAYSSSHHRNGPISSAPL